MNDYYEVTIDWTTPLSDFKREIKGMVNYCKENNKVITIPIKAIEGQQYMFQIAAILEQVDCRNCDALCCKMDMSEEKFGIPLWKADYALLKKYHPRTNDVDEIPHLTFPCSLLEGDACGAYKERPLPCVLYPIQFVGKYNVNHAIALSSMCPEARRIAMQFYLVAWRVFNSVHRHKEEFVGRSVKCQDLKI